MADILVDELVVRLRADASGFESGISGALKSLDGFEAAAQSASQSVNSLFGQDLTSAIGSSWNKLVNGMEGVLSNFIQTGKVSFDSLRTIAVKVMNDIAAAMINSMGNSNSSQGSGFSSILSSLANMFAQSGFFQGRATGGPVSRGMPYLVGEQGPELFMPAEAGEILASHNRHGTGRAISITINVNGGDDSRAARASAGQIAAAVRRAMMSADRQM